ncbi:MAG: hypothetical protein K2X93_29190 [Candidatus Obscuribacterales bacterium]|nr:hypothetical protein [Candidatus Obscuribacterales bacterium]
MVDVSVDEIRTQSLIFNRLPEMHEKPVYRVEEVPLDPNKQELLSYMEFFRVRQTQGWRPICVMEAPLKAPIAVLAQVTEPKNGATIKAVPLSLKAFGKRAISVVDEICELQSSLGLMMACVLHGGLNPILIMVAKPKSDMYEYLVDHAFGGFYQNQTTTLNDLIHSRGEEGWQVCGIFEDVFL